MQYEGEYFHNELPAIELELDEDFSFASSLDGRTSLTDSRGWCHRRRCLWIASLVLVSLGVTGMGVGFTKGLRKSTNTSAVVSKSVADENTSQEPAALTTNSSLTTLEETTSSNVPAPFSLTMSPASTPTPVSVFVPIPTSTPAATPATSFPRSDATLYPSHETWIFTGTPSIGAGGRTSPFVQETGKPTPAPSASPVTNFPTAVPTATPATGTMMGSTMGPTMVSNVIPSASPLSLAAQIELANKVAWPELVGMDVNEAASIVLHERDDLYTVLLHSGVDHPPVGFDPYRVVIYHTPNGIVDRTPIAG